MRGDEQGLGVKINRIVLQTLTFTSGILGIAPANHGSFLLSDRRHGKYLINRTLSLDFTTTLSPLFLLTQYTTGKNIRCLYRLLLYLCLLIVKTLNLSDL
jgi:hypothetical protein